MAAPVLEEDGAVSLVDIGSQALAGGDGDGCSKAYDKFKADVAKVTSLKEVSDKQVQKLEKEKRTADEGLKRCNSDHKEINEKATFKKENNERKIKAGIKGEIAKAKAQLKIDLTEGKADLTAKMKAAKRKQKASKKKADQWRKKYSDTKRTTKAKFKKKLKNFKTDSKAEMKRQIKLDTAEGIMKNSEEVTKAVTKKFTKKLAEAAQDAASLQAREKKKSDFAFAELKENSRRALEKAKANVPPSAEKELQSLKDQLAAALKGRQAAESATVKAQAATKEAKATLVETTTKITLKSEDCEARETKLQSDLGDATAKTKVLQVKLDEKSSQLNRKNNEIPLLNNDKKQMEETMKAKDEVFAVTSQKLKAEQIKATKCDNKYKMTMAKLSSGEGALMAEIETLKSGADNDAHTIVQMKAAASKMLLDNTKVEREKNQQTMKLRETSEELFGAKRDTEKYKVKYDTLESAHTTTTERYRNCHNKLELCSDRTKDAKIKEQGCEEAMRRMKTYNTDQQNEQKLELGRLRTELETAKNDASKLQVTQEEKAQSAAMAKEATEKAVADAVAEAQAKGLAVTANAQEAVDRAAKEAVRLANKQANQN